MDVSDFDTEKRPDKKKLGVRAIVKYLLLSRCIVLGIVTKFFSRIFNVPKPVFVVRYPIINSEA